VAPACLTEAPSAPPALGASFFSGYSESSLSSVASSSSAASNVVRRGCQCSRYDDDFNGTASAGCPRRLRSKDKQLCQIAASAVGRFGFITDRRMIRWQRSLRIQPVDATTTAFAINRRSKSYHNRCVMEHISSGIERRLHTQSRRWPSGDGRRGRTQPTTSASCFADATSPVLTIASRDARHRSMASSRPRD
jgi:hypothetical protein